LVRKQLKKTQAALVAGALAFLGIVLLATLVFALKSKKDPDGSKADIRSGTITGPALPQSVQLPPSASASASATETAPTTTASGSSADLPDMLQFTIEADRPIEKIQARPKPKRMFLENGRATISFAAIKGKVKVDAELEGGESATGELSEKGPRTVKLTTVKRVKAVATGRPGLHGSPYGED
jgi:hypothetical protein